MGHNYNKISLNSFLHAQNRSKLKISFTLVESDSTFGGGGNIWFLAPALFERDMDETLFSEYWCRIYDVLCIVSMVMDDLDCSFWSC